MAFTLTIIRAGRQSRSRARARVNLAELNPDPLDGDVLGAQRHQPAHHDARGVLQLDRRVLLGGFGLAAAVAAGVVLTPVLSRQRYRTLVGEIRRVPLADGSMAAINTDTTLDVRFQKAERAVTLDRGEAWFQVAKDAPRPFVVESGPVRVR